MNNGTQLLIFFSISLWSFGCFADNKKNTVPEKYQPILSKEKNSIKKKTGLDAKLHRKIKYIPPFLGAPSTDRLSGMGVRSTEKQVDLLFSVLTPTHIGLTSQSQPLLYWFTSKPISKPFQFVEFVLNSEESISPILRTHLSQIEQNGIHQLNLANYDITLKPDIEYSWSIALVKNSETRSLDFVSSGKIKYVKPEQKLVRKLQESSAGEKASIYAQSGYWYEALATAVEQQKEQQPDNLTQLINQVELPKIAEYIYSTQPLAITGN